MNKFKKGYTLVEVIVGIFLLTLFISISFRAVLAQHNNRAISIINTHFLNVSNTVGNYLASTTNPNPGAGIFGWEVLALEDARNVNTGTVNIANLKIVEVEVSYDGDETVWSGSNNIVSLISTGTNGYDLDTTTFGGGIIENIPTFEEALKIAKILTYNSATPAGATVLHIGGIGKTVTTGEELPDIGVGSVSVAADADYNMYVFREVNNDTTPETIFYRIIIEPGEQLVNSLGPHASTRLGVETTYQFRNQ